MILRKMIPQGHLHHDAGKFGPGLFRILLTRTTVFPGELDSLCVRKNTVRLNVQRLHMGQFHSTVNSCAGVPAGIGLHAGIHRDRNPVTLPQIQSVGNIHGKWCVSVVMPLYQTAVDGHRSIHHHPVKMKVHSFPLPFLRYCQKFGVGTHPCRKIPHGRPRRRVLSHIPSNHVIVRKLHLPTIIHQVGHSLCKKPVPVPVRSLHLPIPPLQDYMLLYKHHPSSVVLS